MSILSKYSLNSRLPLAGVAVVLSAATLLGGCVVRTVYPAPPPPPRVYVQPAPPPPPPPQAYAEPAVDVEVTAREAPPPLPDYEQPPCPEDGYMWTPGYWAWGGGGYYWVPGTWVQPPRVGVLWTPGYWGFVGGVYSFHVGYWGPHIGYYGGVNYGFGYVGVGFAGGRWVGNSFAYNRTVMNVNVTNVHNTYNETVINNVSVTKVSYNGGPGGTAAVPTAQERVAASEQHVPPTATQHQHVQEALRNPALSARANGGHPAIAATPRPGAFNAPGVVGAHGAGMPPSAAQRGGQPGQFGQNGAQHTPGQPGQPGAAHSPGQPGQPGQANNFVRTPGQPTGAAKTQGQPGQPGGAKPAAPPAKAHPKPETQKGEKEK
jgi:WXXGXW repeat (2 copies)